RDDGFYESGNQVALARRLGRLFEQQRRARRIARRMQPRPAVVVDEGPFRPEYAQHVLMTVHAAKIRSHSSDQAAFESIGRGHEIVITKTGFTGGDAISH